MTAFTLKMIAVITMLIDHIGVALFPNELIFRVIGRVSFPLFVYLIAEGFRFTRNKEKFLLRLFIFALISEPLYMIAIRDTPLSQLTFTTNNIFITLFLGGLLIIGWDLAETILLKLVIIIPIGAGVLLVAEFLSADYGVYGVVFIFIMYVIKHFWLRKFVMLFLCLWQFNWIISAFWRNQYVSNMHLLMIPAGILPVLLLMCYNGKKGRGWKWFFYIFYPAHLLVLALLK